MKPVASPPAIVTVVSTVSPTLPSISEMVISGSTLLTSNVTEPITSL